MYKAFRRGLFPGYFYMASLDRVELKPIHFLRLCQTITCDAMGLGVEHKKLFVPFALSHLFIDQSGTSVQGSFPLPIKSSPLPLGSVDT